MAIAVAAEWEPLHACNANMAMQSTQSATSATSGPPIIVYRDPRWVIRPGQTGPSPTVGAVGAGTGMQKEQREFPPHWQLSPTGERQGWVAGQEGAALATS
jgi:hypothetical protein